MEKMENKQDSNQEYQLATIQKYTNNLAQLYSQTLKIRDFAPDNPKWKDIKNALNYSTVLVGCPQILTNEEYDIVKDFLIDEYKDFSAEEILIAFKKVSSGAIKVDIQHYGNLSPMYIGAVLNAFKAERHKALAQELKDRPKEVVIASREDKERARTEFLEKCLFKPYSEIKEKGLFDVDRHIASQLFRIFRRAKIIDVSPSEDEKYFQLGLEALKNAARTDYKEHKPMLKVMEGIKALNNGENDNIQVKALDRAQGLYFVDYIMNLHKNNRDIKLIAKKL
jgi:hypothetical protein